MIDPVYGRIPFAENLRNGSAKSMVGDGSVTPRVFTYTPSGTVILTSLQILLDDNGATGLASFGTRAVLANGLLIQAVVDGVTYTIANIKDNADLCTRFDFSHFGNGATSTLGAAMGFGESADVFVGSMTFQGGIALLSTDSVQITVRDDLSTIATLQAAITGFTST